MKTTRRINFVLPVEGGQHPPISGRLTVYPDGGKKPHTRGKLDIRCSRSEIARALREWRKEDPQARQVPRYLVASALVKRFITRALEMERGRSLPA